MIVKGSTTRLMTSHSPVLIGDCDFPEVRFMMVYYTGPGYLSILNCSALNTKLRCTAVHRGGSIKLTAELSSTKMYINTGPAGCFCWGYFIQYHVMRPRMVKRLGEGV